MHIMLHEFTYILSFQSSREMLSLSVESLRLGVAAQSPLAEVGAPAACLGPLAMRLEPARGICVFNPLLPADKLRPREEDALCDQETS